ncbi:MAG: GNAT family N-acetyltransferase [Nannocystaceae bacterium]|nr:GNAT family N-acetyltransferase [bacterium]
MTVPFVLDTARLHLRRIDDGHLDDLVALDSDPAVMRFINGGSPTPRSLYEDTLLERMKAFGDQPFGYAAAYEEHRFVGWFHLRPSVADASVLELGYRLRRDAWGRGLATEGSRALVDYAFGELDRTCVDACTMPENAASIGVMKKCGMHYAGTFVHPRAGFEVVRYLVER